MDPGESESFGVWTAAVSPFAPRALPAARRACSPASVPASAWSSCGICSPLTSSVMRTPSALNTTE